MKQVTNLLLGLFAALAMSLLVLGAASLAVVEGNMSTSASTAGPGGPIPGLTAQPGFNATPTPAAGPAVTLIPRSASMCPMPDGWKVYTIQVGDTLDSLSSTYQVSDGEIQSANCLDTSSLIPGTTLYLPPVVPTSTKTASATPVACTIPVRWVAYVVQPGDTLFSLSLALGISVPEMQTGNCMGATTHIYSGTILYVPFIPVRQSTSTPTATMTSALPTGTPDYQPTAQSTATSTATNLPTHTGTPSPTATLEQPTQTPVIAGTNSPTPSSTVEISAEPSPQTSPEVSPTPEVTLTPEGTLSNHD